MFKRAIAAGLVLLMSGTAVAQDAPVQKPGARTTERQPAGKSKALTVGDKPPAMMVKSWVKGDPVTGFENGRVYVIDFWATWCEPCKEAIPHLSELQAKYKSKATVVGVSVWELDDGAVEPFVKEWSPRMGYAVATDESPALPEDVKNGTRDARTFRQRNGRMSQGWLGAAKRDGIPTAFIINQEGTIAWIGDPRAMDDPLEQVVAGTWDLKRATARNKAEQDVQAIMEKTDAAMRQQNWDAVLKVIDEEIGKDADRDLLLARYKFQVLLQGARDYDKAYAFGREALTKYFNDDADALNEMAWLIIDPDADPKVEKQDVELALKAATRATELTRQNNAAILDTLALATFLKGDAGKALELQKKAVALATGPMKTDLEGRLRKFEEAARDGKK